MIGATANDKRTPEVDRAAGPENSAVRKNLVQKGVWAASEVLDLLLPPACRLCNEPITGDNDFCRVCDLGLTLSEPLMASACRRCGRPGAIPATSPASPPAPVSSSTADQLASQQARAADEQGAENLPTTMNAGIEPCSLCKKETFAFDRVIACWTYEGRVCDAIVAAKYAQQSPLGKALGRRLGMRVATATASDPPDQITYVPSNFRRQLSRGGRNGNVAIAHAVSDSLANAGLKVPVRALLRTTRGIKKQAWLNEQQRRENVRGAFAAKKSYACLRTSRLAKSHILLVDDVLTTGATSNEIARVLRQAGAHQVTLAVVARAVWSK